MRKVQIFSYKLNSSTGSYDPVDTSEIGSFIKFGTDYEELENGVGIFSSAIIEMDDGSVKNIPVENIKFIKD